MNPRDTENATDAPGAAPAPQADGTPVYGPGRARTTTRRAFLTLGAFAGIAGAGWVNGFALEPTWLEQTRASLGSGAGGTGPRIVQLSDIHHRGDLTYLQQVLEQTNALKPDLVCFTGDMVEEERYWPEAWEAMRALEAPLYGIPGNHDFWARVTWDAARAACAATGGAFLVEETALLPAWDLEIVGTTLAAKWRGHDRRTTRRLLLLHYPQDADMLDGQRYDAILAGHSHGGQVRIPGYGAVILPYRCGRYQMGVYETAAGPMYVNRGIGHNALPVRFCCRPEIALITI